jgi:hypothetical protein
MKSQRYPSSSGNTIFLPYADQLRLEYSIVQALPPNCFARAAIGYLFAIQHGAEYIYDFDDDNILINVSQGLAALKGPHHVSVTLVSRTRNCVNPYTYYKQDARRIWPRGFPLGDVKSKSPRVEMKLANSISVIQFLQNLNPDLDAIYRLTQDIPKEFDPTRLDCVAIDPRHYAPFNAQSTLFHESAFFGMVLPMSVNGRVSDIWRSYILERILRVDGGQIAFCPAIVEHHRNQHGLTRDFNAELPLYQQAGAILKFLDETVSPRKGLQLDSLREIYICFAEYGILGDDDIGFVDYWINDYLNAKASAKILR